MNDAQSYIDKNPLTGAEWSEGRAIRIPLCLGRDMYNTSKLQAAFFWVVICLCRDETDNCQPKVEGLKGLLCRITENERYEVHVSFEEEVASWSAVEYSILVPYGIKSFSVHCAGQVRKITREERDEMIWSYRARVCNAAGDVRRYAEWFKRHHEENLLRETIEEGPLMSIVTPAYMTPPEYLQELLESVIAQTYRNWELVLVNASPTDEGMKKVINDTDDSRIVVLEVEHNLGIAGNTNIGIAKCTGDYVSFLDHDDLLEPNALAEMVIAMERSETPVDLLYCDEDSFEENGTYHLPLFKPDLNVDLLYSCNYVIHLLTVSRFVLDRIERSGSEMDGSQDYDLTLKALEVARGVVHIPRILYHWRVHSFSTNSNPEAKPYTIQSSLEALAGHFSRLGVRIRAEKDEEPFAYKVRFLFSNDGDTQRRFSEQDNKDFDNLVIEPGVWGASLDGSLRFICDIGRQAWKNMFQFTSELILVSSVCVSVQRDDWHDMLGLFSRADVFGVSPRVVRNDGLVDYAGILVTPEGRLLRQNRFLPAVDSGYIGRAKKSCDSFVLNPELCIFRTLSLQDLDVDDRFQTQEYLIADVCAQQWEKGRLAVFSPLAEAILQQPRSMLRMSGLGEASDDADLFLEKWSRVMPEGMDPSYNRNLDPRSAYYRLKQTS
ncbi:glycosyltransferase family 2 protein [Adlercreutzia sp. ZJ141]|uniref:glycosyltransferase family 2 protein n=1 Tax=Adlercreutzia sp. ZJ141 TaxID=2709406 RepID=UPI0013E9C21F|nr:glycosyltransferase [Adlercreutzia sp. ZJ141]